eukprot:CAMPEP_0197415512 /NCGR_PEP_ID=MMETSP1170-20131217/2027_1 /TAXON_ID=54406 /ORGANISM="Sarcinochrysis sp, Strain CCMP770" /LENGTH=56 /DNA_ID=CAMNT_0042942319 /DNA_START=21 /DNA_END=188 /DNA_ORIENTATION=-
MSALATWTCDRGASREPPVACQRPQEARRRGTSLSPSGVGQRRVRTATGAATVTAA